METVLVSVLSKPFVASCISTYRSGYTYAQSFHPNRVHKFGPGWQHPHPTFHPLTMDFYFENLASISEPRRGFSYGIFQQSIIELPDDFVEGDEHSSAISALRPVMPGIYHGIFTDAALVAPTNLYPTLNSHGATDQHSEINHGLSDWFRNALRESSKHSQVYTVLGGSGKTDTAAAFDNSSMSRAAAMHHETMTDNTSTPVRTGITVTGRTIKGVCSARHCDTEITLPRSGRSIPMIADTTHFACSNACSNTLRSTEELSARKVCRICPSCPKGPHFWVERNYHKGKDACYQSIARESQEAYPALREPRLGETRRSEGPQQQWTCSAQDCDEKGIARCVLHKQSEFLPYIAHSDDCAKNIVATHGLTKRDIVRVCSVELSAAGCETAHLVRHSAWVCRDSRCKNGSRLRRLRAERAAGRSRPRLQRGCSSRSQSLQVQDG